MTDSDMLGMYFFIFASCEPLSWDEWEHLVVISEFCITKSWLCQESEMHTLFGHTVFSQFDKSQLTQIFKQNTVKIRQ